MSKKTRGGAYEIPSDVAYSYLSDKRSELNTHWANPAYLSRGGSRNKKIQKGGMSMREFPFANEYNDYPAPNRVSFALDEAVGTNFVSNKDMFGCAQKGGMASKKNQRGGDCGCTQPIMLGGSKKKQRGAGYGYSMNIPSAITNRPEVVRYSTETQQGGRRVANKQKGDSNKQRGGSMASDSLMEYFLDFQHRCRNTEIY